MSKCEAVMEGIEKSALNFNVLADRTDTCVLVLTNFGRNFFLQHKISPDSALQMAYQYAYRKMYGIFGTAYESVSMKNFYHGRTDVARACSQPAIDWVNTMLR